jgi:RimJ/RimL family protein N-acetyltransferase
MSSTQEAAAGRSSPSMNELATSRLRLEPLVVGHAEAMFDVLADASLHRHLDGPPPQSVDALRERYARLESRRSPDGEQHWLNWIIVGSDGTAMGFVQATVMPDRTAWIAYLLGRSYQRQGFATEATQAVLEHIRGDHRVVRVRAMVDVDNAASVRLLERLGFREVEYDGPSWPGPSERLFVFRA